MTRLYMCICVEGGLRMLKLIPIFIFLISMSSIAATNLVPHDSEDQGPNIPSIGSSLFDKIYSKENASGEVYYNVPYPLDKLVTQIGMDGNFVHMMFPFSRSLQRPKDLSYDPISNPRIVFSPQGDNYSITRGKIFFGYVQARDSLEVISYNDEAGRFEYQIVTDYSHDPKVFYVNRGKCLSCHQGQAPIFSPPGWSDSSVGIMGRLIDAKRGILGNTREEWIQSLFGVNKTQEQVGIFDELVRESNNISLDERIWVYGCGEDNKCRLGLLINTLCRNSSYTETYLEHTQDVISKSPLLDQRYYSSFLTDYDIGASEVVKKYGSLENVVTSPNAILEIIANIYNLAPKDNPATKRTLSLGNKALVRPLSSFLLSDQEILNNEIPTVNNLAEILIDLFNDGSEIFNQNAINKLKIMSTILRKAHSQKAEQYSIWMNKKTPVKQLSDSHFQPIFQTAQLNILSRYCSACHAAGLPFPPQYLLGTEAEVIHQVTQLKDKMIYKLENNLMPPNAADREILKNSGDRERILNYLRGL